MQFKSIADYSRELSATLSTLIKLPLVFKNFVLLLLSGRLRNNIRKRRGLSMEPSVTHTLIEVWREEPTDKTIFQVVFERKNVMEGSYHSHCL